MSNKSLKKHHRKQHRGHHKNPKAIYEDPAHSKKIRVPEHQFAQHIGYQTKYSIDIDSIPNDAINDNVELQFDLDQKEIPQVEGDLFWRLDIACDTADVTCQNMAYFFSKQEFKSLPEEILADVYNFNVLFWILNVIPKDERKGWYKLFGLKEVIVDGKRKVVNDLTFKAGRTRTVLIPIAIGALHFDLLDMQHITSDLRFDCQIDNANWVVSGSAANLTLKKFSLEVLARAENAEERKERMKEKNMFIDKAVFLDHERATFKSTKVSMTAGEKSEFVIDKFNHKSAFIVMFLTEGVSSSGEQLINWLEAGDDRTALFNLESSAGERLKYKGFDCPQIINYEEFQREMGERAIKGLYVLPFSKIKDAIAGKMDGGFVFDKSNYAITVTFSATGVAHVSTITLSNPGNDAGQYQFFVSETDGYRESDISSVLTFNDNAAAIKASLEATKPLSDRGYTVTASGTAESTFTLTFDANEDGDISENVNIKVISNLTDGGVVETPVTTMSTTGGRKGWAGTNATLHVYSYVFNELTISDDGSISSKKIY